MTWQLVSLSLVHGHQQHPRSPETCWVKGQAMWEGLLSCSFFSSCDSSQQMDGRGGVVVQSEWTGSLMSNWRALPQMLSIPSLPGVCL